jgi:hypothetical protein
MKKLLLIFLSAGRKRRTMAVGAALWLLRQVCDVEKDELYRLSDKLDELGLDSEGVSRREYSAAEEGYSDCECALGFLECAIDDLEFAY